MFELFENMFELSGGWKIFNCRSGLCILSKENSCIFCKHCTDIFYDSKGIYAIFCAKHLETVEGMKGDCKGWEGDTLK